MFFYVKVSMQHRIQTSNAESQEGREFMAIHAGSRSSLRAVFLSAAAVAAITSAEVAHAQDQAPAETPSADTGANDDIVVTARLRAESLLDVPVAVTALGKTDLERYGAASLTAIAQQTPNIIINKSSSGGGGQITLRGISTAAGQAGFDQAVSVNLDGIQTSRGRTVTQGFFDLQQVEVLKGPQALFFGRNSPAGVISLISSGPTDELEGYARVGYEFNADEAYSEVAVGGPLSDTLGARFAIRARNLKGWMRNLAVPQPTPFNTPGASDPRAGEREVIGRLTLRWEPTSDFNATLKVLGSDYNDDGPSAGNIQIVSCGTSPRPEVTFGGTRFFDPTGDCQRDSRNSNGDQRPDVARNWPVANMKNGVNFTEYRSWTGSLSLNYQFGGMQLTSVTGLFSTRAASLDTYDGTSFAQIAAAERDRFRQFSQELRLQSDFDSPLNFMIGGFFSDTNHFFFNASRIAPVPADPATGKFHSWEKPSSALGRTYSVFGQLRYEIGDVELAGGARYTREIKDSRIENTYVHPALRAALQLKGYTDNFRDSNVSPEATISWHPLPDTTIYAAYKTGYKSGGLGLSAVLTTPITVDQIDYEAERVKGFEFGAKGEFLDRKLRAELTVYRYKFTDLQVNSFNPGTQSFTIQNAASLTQFGVEAQAQLRPFEGFQLRGSIAYNRNRFDEYVGQCYTGQTPALGCGPQGQDFAGRAPARSPDWSGSGGATYDVDLGGATLGFTGDAFYSGAYFGGESLSPYAFQESYWRFDASARLSFDDNNYELALIGRNLSNERFLQSTSDKPGTSSAQQYGTVSRPREIILQGTVRF